MVSVFSDYDSNSEFISLAIVVQESDLYIITVVSCAMVSKLKKGILKRAHLIKCLLENVTLSYVF